MVVVKVVARGTLVMSDSGGSSGYESNGSSDVVSGGGRGSEHDGWCDKSKTACRNIAAAYFNRKTTQRAWRSSCMQVRIRLVNGREDTA
jgi:hypothetical protein